MPTLFIEYDPDNRKSKDWVKEIREEYHTMDYLDLGKSSRNKKSKE